jgi:hypothetical protein
MVADLPDPSCYLLFSGIEYNNLNHLFLIPFASRTRATGSISTGRRRVMPAEPLLARVRDWFPGEPAR